MFHLMPLIRGWESPCAMNEMESAVYELKATVDELKAEGFVLLQ